MAAPLSFELLAHRCPTTDRPDTDITVACWTAEDGFFSGFWDDVLGLWVDCATGAPVAAPLLAWADPHGPAGLRPLPPSDVPVHQVRAALSEALDLLRGWIDHKCPKKHREEHLQVVKTLADAGGVS